MNNIFKAFNVTSQREFDNLIESLELDSKDTATLFTVLNEDVSCEYLRKTILETAVTFGNGSYEKLQKQFEKPAFKRQLKEMPMNDEQYNKLKVGDRVKFDKPSQAPQPEEYDTILDKSDDEIKTQFRHHGGKARTVCKWKPEHFKQVYSALDEETVFDHSWYEVKKQKYPKRTKDGVICEDDKEENWDFWYGDKYIGSSVIKRNTETGEGVTIAEKYNVNPDVLDKLYDIITTQFDDLYMANYDEIDGDKLFDTVDDFGREIDGYDPALKQEYVEALKQKWIFKHPEEKISESNDDEHKTIEMDYDYVLADIDGVEQWCFIIEKNKDGNFRVEPLNTDDYGDELPLWSVNKKNFIRFPTKEESRKLDNGEMSPYVNVGKSDRKKSKLKEDVNINYISPKLKMMIDNWMSSGNEDDKEYVSVLDDLVYLYKKLNNENEVKQWIEYFYQMETDDRILNAGKYILRYIQQDPTNMIQMDDHYLYNYLDENGIQEMERIKQKYGINEKRKELENDLKYNINESINTELDLGKILGSMKNVISTTTSIQLLNKLYSSLEEKSTNAKSEEDLNKINEIKSLIKERVNEINNIGKEDDTIKECFDYSVPVSPVFNDVEVNSTLEDMFNNIKPATINIEINYEEKTDEDEEEMAKNNMRALASHIGNDVDCCEENRIEELETVNTLLSMLSDYFNKKLGV